MQNTSRPFSQPSSQPLTQSLNQPLTQQLSRPFYPAFSQASSQPCLANGPLAITAALGAQTLPVVIASSALKCFGQIGNGAVSSAKGLWSQIKTAVTNPKAFWESQVKVLADIKNFLLNIGSELQKFAQDLKGIDAGLLVDMACSLIGQLAPDILLVLAGGVGLAKLLPKLLSWFARFKNSKMALAAMSTLKKKGLLQNPSAILKNILDGKMPIAVEGKLAGLANKYPQALNALLSCR